MHLGKTQRKGVLRRPDRSEMGEIPGRHDRILQGPGETSFDDTIRQDGVLFPELGQALPR